MSGKKMTIYLIPLVAIPAIVLLGILMGLFSWRNMAHIQDSHTQDSRQSATKVAQAIAVVEQHNRMKQDDVLGGGRTWWSEYAGFDIINAQETGSGVDVTVREYIINRHVEGDGGLGWQDRVYTVIRIFGKSFIVKQKVDVRRGNIKRWPDKMPNTDDIRRMLDDLKKQAVDYPH
ncbi:MAG: hypothetical protein AB1556_07285 [Bacillota bacterium]